MNYPNNLVIVYEINCLDCYAVFIGKSARKLEKNSVNIDPPVAALIEHVIRSKGNKIDRKNVRVLEPEPKNFARRIFEAIHIRTLKPKLICDKEVDLDHIWDNYWN